MDLSGAISPLVTSTVEDRSEVKTEALNSFTRFLVDGDVHAFFPCRSIGGFSSLTRAQRKTVIETAVDNAGDTPVFAGCGGASIGEVRGLIADAATAGADMAVVVTHHLTCRERDTTYSNALCPYKQSRVPDDCPAAQE